MLRLPKKEATHEELFLDRYPELMSWALQISSYDRTKAEDLVHDAYIQWTLVRPNLQAIHNLEGYLYGMLRNMHSAELRRAFRASSTSLSVVEYDSALLSLQQASDEVRTAQMQDHLRSVCAYACVRKQTSKAGSLLLLRFFHGYYPGEAARIAGIKRVTVDSWLRIARAEAKLYLEDPEALRFMKEKAKPTPVFSANRSECEFLDEISERITQSCCGPCLRDKELSAVYTEAESEPLDCETLAHIVSCQRCLTKAGKILNLPSKDDRYPPDFLGRDPQPGEKSIRKQRGPHNLGVQMEDVVEHRPKELHVAVNGFTVGTQKVISERIEHSLKLSLLEQIGLVEVLSEQGIRLLCLYVEAPPNGAIEQAAYVHLSDERTLNVALNFNDQWPNLELAYSDPHFAEVTSDPEKISELDQRSLVTGESELTKNEASSRPNLASLIRAIRIDRHFWLRPGPVTALAMLVLAIVLLAVYKSSPPPVAADILARAQAVEQIPVAGRDQVLHRSISFEERRGSTTISHHKVEIWRADGGNTARRLYDENGVLVAGAWQSGADASQNVFYHHGSKLKVSPPSADIHSIALEHLWLLDPSAATFSALVNGMIGEIHTEDHEYILTYRQKQGAADEPYTLLEATLVIDRASLHPVSQSLIFAQGTERKQFAFRELSFERLPAANVDQRVFQPDAELLTPIDQPTTLVPPASPAIKPLPAVPIHLATAAELGALEVNVLYLLDQINANSGEQIEVRRLPGRELLVEAIVDTDKRKREILDTLASVSTNRLVRMDVVTLEEALRRETAAKRAPESLSTVVIFSDRIPVYEEVRHYLEREVAGRGTISSSAEIDTEISHFSSRMIDQSRQALLHAFALKHLVERFSAADVASLSEESRRKWHEMIRTHARGFRQGSGVLRRELRPVFPNLETSQSFDRVSEIRDDAGLLDAVKSLVNFASATDDAVSRSFSLSPDARPATNTPANSIFWRTLNRADSLAAALEAIP
jgi:RNA polymerase sigma factor (sigma-70 family)